MIVAISVLALVLKLAGFGFLCAAAVGVLRFADPLQRMHAATKAGTVGAGLTVAGSALALGDTTSLVVGGLTIVFLIFTVPIAGHMLGRAIYVAGSTLTGLDSRDALKGVLARHVAPTPGARQAEGEAQPSSLARDRPVP